MNPRSYDQPPSAPVEVGPWTLTLGKSSSVAVYPEVGPPSNNWSSDGLEVLIDDDATLRLRDTCRFKRARLRGSG